MSLALFVASFLFLLFAGLPVAWTMVASSVVWLAASGQMAFLAVLPERIFQGIDVFVLMAIPLFVLAGELVNEGRITDRLVAFANVLFGWMPGGLAQVNIARPSCFPASRASRWAISRRSARCSFRRWRKTAIRRPTPRP